MAKQLYDFAGNEVFPIVECNNNLTSTSTTIPLSAAQGKVLKDLIDSKTHIQFKIVTSLTTTGQSNTIYLVAKADANGTNDIYDEYIWINGKYEYLGTMTTPAVVTKSCYSFDIGEYQLTKDIIDGLKDAINYKLPIIMYFADGEHFISNVIYFY